MTFKDKLTNPGTYLVEMTYTQNVLVTIPDPSEMRCRIAGDFDGALTVIAEQTRDGILNVEFDDEIREDYLVITKVVDVKSHVQNIVRTNRATARFVVTVNLNFPNHNSIEDAKSSALSNLGELLMTGPEFVNGSTISTVRDIALEDVSQDSTDTNLND